jgi:TPR repeat protein
MNKILTTIVFTFTISTGFGQTADEIFKQAIALFKGYDQKNAALLLKKSAEMGHAEAQYRYGFCFRDGLGVKKNDSIASIWFLKSAKQGWADAQHNIGYNYASGRGIKQDYNQAFYWTLKCAEQKNPGCINDAVWYYANGKGTAKNLDSAAVWTLKLASLSYAYSDDIDNIDKVAETGDFLDNEFPDEAELITNARATLAMLYQSGEYYPKDKIKSYMWFLIYNETKEYI